MRVYTVHLDPTRRPEDAIFVKDGFCWPALFVPLLWILYRRLWLGLLVWLLAGFGLAFLMQAGDLDDRAGTAVMLGFNLLVAFEANDWRRRTLVRRGWPQVAAVAAPNLASAEMRYFGHVPAKDSGGTPPPPFPTRRPAPPPLHRSLTETPMLGLYPQPERRP